MVIALGNCVPGGTPLVLRTDAVTDTIQPSLKGPIVIPYAVIGRCLKLVRVMVAYLVDARSTPNRPFRGILTTKVYLNVDHIMLLNMLWVVVLSCIENQVSWFHLVLFKLNWQCVILVGLISGTKLKAKFVSQIVDRPSYQRTAVKEEGCCVKWISGFAITFGIGDTQVLLALLDKPLPEPILELMRPHPLIVRHMTMTWVTLGPL